MSRDYSKFELDSDIPGDVILRVRKTIDAILDGGYVNSTATVDREHLAFMVSCDMQIMYYRGRTHGALEAGDRWTRMLSTRNKVRT